MRKRNNYNHGCPNFGGFCIGHNVQVKKRPLATIATRLKRVLEPAATGIKSCPLTTTRTHFLRFDFVHFTSRYTKTLCTITTYQILHNSN